MQKYFNYLILRKQPYVKNKMYKLATEKEVEKLNRYKRIIQKATNFYEDNLADKKIDYIYKNNNELKLMPVKYGRENFPHLTGIDFYKTNALEKYQFLKEGNNKTPILIEKRGRTFDKLKVLSSLPDVLKAKSNILYDLAQVEQSERIGFNKAIVNKKDNLLVALKNFDPKIYQPRSLLNIKNSSEYKDVPENTLLGIFKESDDEFEEIKLGRGTGAIDINRKYIKKPEQVMELTNMINKHLMQNMEQEKHSNTQEESEKHGKKLNKKQLAFRAAMLRRQGLKR